MRRCRCWTAWKFIAIFGANLDEFYMKWWAV
ncbi:MAG: hypothetical protein R2862_09035 [Thermoanaerobaculia bacterium]